MSTSPTSRSRGLGGRQAVDVEAQRGDRGAQPMRQVGDRLAFGGQQLTDAARKPVQGDADLDDLGRAGDLGPRLEIAVTEAVGRAGELGHGIDDGLAHAVRDRRRAGHEHQTEGREKAPRRVHALAADVVGHEDAHRTRARSSN